MKLGYIRKRYLELNPHLKDRFVFVEATCRRSITSKSDRVYSKKFCPLDYSEVEENTKIMKENNGLILVQEPFFIDNKLRAKAIRWVEWANTAKPEEYSIFSELENTEVQDDD